MRHFLVQEITKREEPNLVFLTADLGYNLLEPIKTKFRNRFINCGISEQLMVSMAVGLEREGFIPITYTICPFYLRALEFIRNDIAYPSRHVIMVGVGKGQSYSMQGYTHYGEIDDKIIDLLPAIKVCSPNNEEELKAIIDEAVNVSSPTYIRLG